MGGWSGNAGCAGGERASRGRGEMGAVARWGQMSPTKLGWPLGRGIIVLGHNYIISHING